MKNNILNLFYQEPDPDRWLPFDRYPRRIVRRIVKGKPLIGGVQRWFVNLCEGLDRINVSYTVNDFRRLQRDRQAWAMVVGKPHVIQKIPSENPIIFGPGVSSHPSSDTFWNEKNIKHLLISCEWFKEVYQRDLEVNIPITVWPSGIQTDIWKADTLSKASNQVLIYDKVRWQRDVLEPSFIKPIIELVKSLNYEPIILRYGYYKEKDYLDILKYAKAMIFLCEHETQGFAYQQALSMDVPVFAWDRGGYWQDPYYFPHKVKFSPVSSVPYWDERCGMKFENFEQFKNTFDDFRFRVQVGEFKPREFILENLTLEKCAQKYVKIAQSIME